METSASDADVALALDAALARLEETVGDAGFVAELIGDFLEGLPGQLEALRGANLSGDSEQLHRIAHTLKSNASTFGAESRARACRELEGAAGGGGPGEAGELVARVEAEAGRAAPALAAARDERTP
jgi:HPt (histidine-containing phosphotransfer) domain-containing protein